MSLFRRKQDGMKSNHEHSEPTSEKVPLVYEEDNGIGTTRCKSSRNSKLANLLNFAPIYTSVKKAFLQTKTFFRSFASHLSSTPLDSSESVTKSYVPATETVTFPPCMASMYDPFKTSITFTFTTHSSTTTTHSFNIPTAQQEHSFQEKFRYKQQKPNKLTFPEIQQGIVSTRRQWLETLFAGKTADANKSSLDVKVKSWLEEAQMAGPRDLSQKRTTQNAETSEGSECEYEDSPRRYKHRLPEEEPGPAIWIVPGTVATIGMWLEPIMAGKQRSVRVN